MTTKEDIQKFVDFQLESMDYAQGFENLDSLSKLEMVMCCEQEFFVAINEDDIHHDWDTEMFVDLVYNKIINSKNNYETTN